MKNDRFNTQLNWEKCKSIRIALQLCISSLQLHDRRVEASFRAGVSGYGLLLRSMTLGAMHHNQSRYQGHLHSKFNTAVNNVTYWLSRYPSRVFVVISPFLWKWLLSHTFAYGGLNIAVNISIRSSEWFWVMLEIQNCVVYGVKCPALSRETSFSRYSAMCMRLILLKLYEYCILIGNFFDNSFSQVINNRSVKNRTFINIISCSKNMDCTVTV